MYFFYELARAYIYTESICEAHTHGKYLFHTDTARAVCVCVQSCFLYFRAVVIFTKPAVLIVSLVGRARTLLQIDVVLFAPRVCVCVPVCVCAGMNSSDCVCVCVCVSSLVETERAQGIREEVGRRRKTETQAVSRHMCVTHGQIVRIAYIYAHKHTHSITKRRRGLCCTAYYSIRRHTAGFTLHSSTSSPERGDCAYYLVCVCAVFGLLLDSAGFSGTVRARCFGFLVRCVVTALMCTHFFRIGLSVCVCMLVVQLCASIFKNAPSEIWDRNICMAQSHAIIIPCLTQNMHPPFSTHTHYHSFPCAHHRQFSLIKYVRGALRTQPPAERKDTRYSAACLRGEIVQ